MIGPGQSRRPRAEGGTAVVEFTWLVVLLFIPLVYVVLIVFTAQAASFSASAAARTAARAYLTAPSQAEGEARAEEAVRLAMADQGVDGEVEVAIGCRPDPRSCLSPGSTVRVRVTMRVRLPRAPSVLGSPPGLSIEAVHEEPFGRYREARG